MVWRGDSEKWGDGEEEVGEEMFVRTHTIGTIDEAIQMYVSKILVYIIILHS